MSDSNQITSLLDQACAEHVFSGYQLFCQHGERTLELSGGTTSYWPNRAPVGPHTFFDIGSVTKVIVTTTLMALAIQEKELALENRLEEFVPAFRRTALAEVTLEELLTHSAGLKSWLPIYKELAGLSVEEWFGQNISRVVVAPRRAKVEYSDLGFLLLGIVLEKRYGSWLPLFRARIQDKLLLDEVDFEVPPGAGVVSTEFCLERNRLLTGEVFDENCWALGGISAHAGLFATARGLAPFCREWLKAVSGTSQWITKEIAVRFTQKSSMIASTDRALGWDTKSKVNSSAGNRFSLSSFGHLGYTGTSLWIDPEAQGFAVFLTNRVHPSRFDTRIRTIRPELHDRIVQWWSGS